MTGVTEDEGRPAGEWLYRTAEQLDVNFPDRTIEMIVMPYDEEALVPYGGRMVWERIDAGAFDGIEKRANRIRVNRDHKLDRTIGRAVAFTPDDSRGLVGRIRVSRTPLGDETLELAGDGALDASAGFLPMPGGTTWLDREHVQYSRCWLGHIALTPEPAYEGAQVLAVRESRSPPPIAATETPNLDTVRGWRLEQAYSLLER